MDSELLKTFLEVSRTRHFGRAAETLYLTQSAVSFRIRQLENQLGVSLFTRHRNNIRLTTAGERLLPYAENLINTWLAAKKDVALFTQYNQLSIGASASLWECLLTPWLSSLYQKRSDAQFEVRIAPRESLVKQLHERKLDLLLSTEASKMDEFTSQVLADFNLALYAGDLACNRNSLSYIRVEWGADFQHYESEFIASDEIPILTTSSASMACQLIPLLNGYTFLPTEWADKQQALYPVTDSAVISRSLYAIWPKTTDKQTIIKSLIKTPLIAQ